MAGTLPNGGQGGAESGFDGGAGASDGTGAAGGGVARGGAGGGTGAVDGGGAGESGAGAAAAGGTDSSPACSFELTATISSEIPTVGILTWSVNMSVLERASVEFGLDEAYGLTAPVDLDAPARRTLLLGMKASRDYHYRVVADGGGEHCESPDQVLTTGPLQNGLLPILKVATPLPERVTQGFIVSSILESGPAFIIDQDGDYVWWFGSGEMGRATQSYDGKSMWIGNINVLGGAGLVERVGMDGEDAAVFPEFGDYSHDLTVLPDETVGFIQHSGSCDAIMERAPDGSVRELVNVEDAHGGTYGRCHTNSIHYHVDDDTYTFSDLDQNTYVKITREGKVVWILGGSTSQFSGDGAAWMREHGHQLIAPDRLLFFNNQKQPPSLAVEVKLDFDAMTATRVFEYDGGFSSPIYGDVQRLADGNTLVTYSTAGVIHLIDPDGNLVRSFTASLGGAFGYATFRTSLYGPPPAL